MSSILRALKKIDEESMSGDQVPGKQKIKMRRIVYRRTRSPRLINRAFFIVSAVLLLGTAALLFINLNKKPPVTKKQDISPGKPALTHLPRQAHPQVPQQVPQQVPPLENELKEAPAGEAQPPPDSNSAAERIQPVVPNDPGELTEEMKHPGFILNGVLWSDKPGRRVALINDKYLKEGETIDGVLVVEIGKNAVTLQSGAEKWTLRVRK